MRSFVRGAVFFAVAGMASIPLSLVLFRVLSIMCPLALWLVPCGTGGDPRTRGGGAVAVTRWRRFSNLKLVCGTRPGGENIGRPGHAAAGRRYEHS